MYLCVYVSVGVCGCVCVMYTHGAHSAPRRNTARTTRVVRPQWDVADRLGMPRLLPAGIAGQADVCMDGCHAGDPKPDRRPTSHGAGLPDVSSQSTATATATGTSPWVVAATLAPASNHGGHGACAEAAAGEAGVCAADGRCPESEPAKPLAFEVLSR